MKITIKVCPVSVYCDMGGVMSCSIAFQCRSTINGQSIIPTSRLDGWFCLMSHRQRGHLETAPHLLSLVKDVKLDKYTVPTGN